MRMRFWTGCVPRQFSGTWRSTGSIQRSKTRPPELPIHLNRHGYASLMADAVARTEYDCDSAADRDPAGALDRRRDGRGASAGAGGSGASAGASADGDRLLSAGGAGAADCAGTSDHPVARTSAGIFILRVGGGIGVIQPAVCGAAAG